jgi:hypothetical protein
MNRVLAIDMGGRQDPTAYALGEYGPDGTTVLHMERAPLGVSYKKQHDRAVQLVTSTGCGSIVMDATGIGLPQVESLTEIAPVPVTGVLITSGAKVGGTWNLPTVPKRYLVSALQVAVEQGRLKIASGIGLADVALHELASYKFKVSASGNETYGNGDARGDSDHDDIVIALALLVWFGESRSGSVGAYVPGDRPAVNAGGIIDSLLRQGVDASEIPRWFGRR